LSEKQNSAEVILKTMLFQFPNKLHSDFCGIVSLQLVFNKAHAHFQLNLKVERWVNY